MEANKTFDDQFEKLIFENKLKWFPWVGRNYQTNDNKILVIGESHYCGTDLKSLEKHENPEFTRKFVVPELAIKYLTDDKRSATLFRNFNLGMFALKSIKESAREEGWGEMSFYNFIQEPMKDIKQRPTKVQIENGWLVFKNLIEILKPTKVIFIGSKVSEGYNKYLKNLRIEFEKIRIINTISERQKHRLLRLKIEDEWIDCHFIKHTSRFFSWKKWNEILPNL
jgi:hypothetical protein